MANDRDWRLGVLALHLGKPMGAVYACALGVGIDRPYFFGEATVKDGFVGCGFVDKNLVMTVWAVVDTFDSVQDHIRKTADYLKLDDEERAEFLGEMNEWIGAAYVVEGRRFTWENGER